MRSSTLFALLATLALSASAQAANTATPNNNFAKNHPRRAEVLKRDRNEKKANANAAAQGKITKGQENKLNREDNNIRAQEQADAKKNGGYITPAEQQGLNREENRVNQQRANMEKNDATGAGSTFAKQHPARAEVLRRDSNEVGKNDAAEATGKINARQADRLNREDASIRRQEQADAKANGGHITAQEDKQLNREENRVNQQRANMEQRDASGTSSGTPAAPAPAPVAPAPVAPAPAAPATGN